MSKKSKIFVDEPFNIREECIPDILPIKNKTLNQNLFYMLYRIKESGLDNALIHMENGLSDWWSDLWNRYEKQIERQNLINRLTGILQENFTEEELSELSEIDSFKIQTDNDQKRY